MEDVIKNLSRRYAVKAYDSSVRITDSQLDTLLEAGDFPRRLMDCSLTKLFAVTDPVLAGKALEASYGEASCGRFFGVVGVGAVFGFPGRFRGRLCPKYIPNTWH